MSSKHLGCDINFAWPSAEIAVMGAEGAIKILYRNQLEESQNPKELEQELLNEYRKNFNDPFDAAEAGFIDEVILPSETRPRLIEALWPLLTKREHLPKKKHDNIPL